jgi:hypothetical protein
MGSDLDILLDEKEVEPRHSHPGVIAGIIVAAGLAVGALVIGGATAVVAISHTELGLCGSFGVPCTSLSLDRVRSLSGVELPDGSNVAKAYYNQTAKLTTFRSVVVLPAGAVDPVGSGYESYPDLPIAARKAWSTKLDHLTYYAAIDGNVVHDVIEGIDRAGHRELALSFIEDRRP